MLDVRRLAVLTAAISEGSLAAAARKLGLTPGAASQAIGALEAQAGRSLLERHARGVRATPAGERLAAQADAVFATLRQAEAELSNGHVGAVRIAAFPSAVIGLVPPVLRRLRESAPGLRIHIVELEPGPARAALRAGDCDLAVVNHHSLLAPDTRGPWEIVHIRDEPVVAALPADHRLARRASVSVGQLADADWIMQQPASPCQELVQRVCATAGFAPRVVATCGDYRSILALVGAGAGVSLIPELALTGLRPPSVALVPTRPVTMRRINALVASRVGVPPAARTALDAFVDQEDTRLAAISATE
jgi:DNA-binding transcriptional LysR family regulator